MPGAPTKRLATFYFCYFAALGAMVPYWSPYLEYLGFTAAEIGELMAIFTGTRILAPLIAGWLADRFGRHLAIVRIGSAFAALTFAGVFWGQGYAWLALTMGCFSFFWAAALPPLEAATLNHLGERAERYSLIRLWGSIGFIVAVLVLGELLDRLGYGILSPVCLGLLALIALSALIIPDPRAPARAPGASPLGAILRQPEVIALFVVAILVQASHGPYYVFFTIHLEHRGYAKSLIGPLWALGVVAEILVFLRTDRLLGRVGPRQLLLWALGLTAARWLLIAGFVDRPAILLLAQTLHAASFGIFHAVMIHYVHHFFVGANQARGQALYSALCYGVGGAAGSLAAGYAWTGLGESASFAAAAALPPLGLLLALASLRPDK